MKNKFLFLLLMAFSLSFIFVSCDKDNEDDKLPPIGGYDKSDDVAKDNLIAKFSFEDNINDAKSNVKNGSTTGTSYIDGKMGKALKGSTTGYTVYTDPGSLSGLGSFTVAFWMNTTNHAEGAESIFMLSNKNIWIGNLFMLHESEPASVQDSARFKIKFDKWDAPDWKEQWIEFGGKNKLTGVMNKWVHMAMTYDGGSSKFNMYVDGKKLQLAENYTNRTAGDPGAGAPPLGNLKFENADRFMFGGYQNTAYGTPLDGWMKNYTGALDEFRVYNKALIDSDIDALYKLELEKR